jgi:hypothetical protein
MIKYVVLGYRRLKVFLKRNVFKRFLKTDQMLSQFLTVTNIYDKNVLDYKRLKALLKRNVFKRLSKTELQNTRNHL